MAYSWPTLSYLVENGDTRGIDEYLHQIVYLSASDNNSSHTLLEGVTECGWLSKVLSDKGGENVDVATGMLRMREQAGRFYHRQQCPQPAH